MSAAAPRAAVAAGLALLVGCFPELPDERLVSDLRILAVRTEPAMLTFDVWPPPPVTLRALVVDPADPDNGDVTYRWSMELGDEDFEGREQLESLIPPEPHGPSVDMDLAPLLAARDGGWAASSFVVRLHVENGETERDALKLVSLLLPEAVGPGDAFVPPREHPDYNTSPWFDGIERVGGDSWTRVQGPAGALDVGAADPEAGVQIKLYPFDNETADISIDAYWTGGDPGLPLPEVDGFGEQPEGGGAFGFGNGRTDGDLQRGDNVYAWTPPDEAEVPIRLFFVLRDDVGAQTWQELRFGE